MRKYNLFIIKKEYYTIYQKRPYTLYELLKNLSEMQANFNYGITLYEQLCKKFECEAIKYYFYNKFHCEKSNKYKFKEGEIELYPSRIIIQSRVDLPMMIFSILNRYNKMIFVCDFDNQDYFFLNSVLQHKLLQTV